jgi:hypothetical protein
MENSDLKFEGPITPKVACEREAILDLAMEALTILDKHLSDFDKSNFRVSIGNFNLEHLQPLAFKVIYRVEIINDLQISAILDCLIDEILRTRLIMRILAKDILKVPVDGISIC